MKHDVEASDLGLASKVWGWLVVRNDVSVGPNRKFNHLPLEEVLCIYEREKAPPTAENPEATPSQQTPSKASSSRPSKSSHKSDGIPETAEPRLYVSEERQWKTLTGHGPDLKRIPLFEWKALVDIASVKQDGILQGDLVRLTGQDKRSLPTRTDALAKKGYIIKQPILLRGCRSSKLWLRQYAENAQEEAKRDGLPLEELDLSKETLMKDLHPVSFCHHWNGDRLDYLAIAQGFVAITKAWGIIRYCDLRTKMGVDERVPQMRALAKSSRWFTNIGSITFVAARFANSSKLFKDCVKFLRDPTPDEWKKFRSIPTNHIKAPSSRIGKRGQASRDNAKSKTKTKPSKAEKVDNGDQVKRLVSKSPDALLDQMEVRSSSWIPQKPFINTVFDIIKRSGAEGSSNNEIRHQTLGYSYRKFIASMNASLSSPLVQPEQLEFKVTSQLSRVGKTMSYQFFAPGEAASSPNDESQDLGQAQADEITPQSVEPVGHAFSTPDPSRFTNNASISLSQLCHPLRPSPKSRTNGKLQGFRAAAKKEAPKPRGRPRKPPQTRSSDPLEVDMQDAGKPEHLADQTPDEETRGPGRLRRKPKSLEDMVVIPDDDNLEDLAIESPIREGKGVVSTRPRVSPLPDVPGVYRGTPNSLDPFRKHGRPHKSIVVIFKSEKLKDPMFLGVTTGSSPAPIVSDIDHTTYEDTSTTLPMAKEENVASAEPDQVSATRGSVRSKKASRLDSKKGLKCQKCGKTWKNPNGLEYHINKSQTPCNPLYVPVSPWQKPLPTPRTMPQLARKDKIIATPSRSQMSPSSSQWDAENGDSIERSHPTHTTTEKGSAAPTPDTPSMLGSTGRSIVLQDVEVYGVTGRGRLRGPRSSKTHPSRPSTPRSPQLSQKHQEAKEDSQPQELQAPKETAPLSNGNGFSKQSTELEGGLQNLVGSSTLNNDNTTPQKRRTSPIVSVVSSGEIAEPDPPRKRQKLSQSVSDQPHESEQENQSGKQATALQQTPTTPAPADLAEPSSIGKTSHPDRFTAQEFALRPPTVTEPAKPVIPETLPKKSSHSDSRIRRERTSEIIQYIFDNHDGVFPGDLTLYIFVASLWARKYADLNPPDRKTVQQLVNGMEKRGDLKQLHFFFLDPKGHSKGISVIVKASSGDNRAEKLSGDPRVVGMKEKIREVYPETYIPPNIPLSQQELDIYSALLSKSKEDFARGRLLYPAGKPTSTHDVEVMHYPRPIMTDVEPTEDSVVSSLVTNEGYNASLAKEVRKGIPASTGPRPPKDETPKIRNARKPRKQARDYWDAGKVATYIWYKNNIPVATWDQKPAYLQDPATGAWSSAPQVFVSSEDDLDSLLNLIKTGKAAKPKKPGRKRKNPDTPVTPRKKRAVRNVPEGKADDESIGDHELNFDATITNEIKITFAEPSTVETFIRTDSSHGSDDYDSAEDTVMDSSQELNAMEDDSTDDTSIRFGRIDEIKPLGEGYWPYLKDEFFRSKTTSFSMSGSMPTAGWFHQMNIPHNVDDMLNAARGGQIRKHVWADKQYAELVRRANAIRNWEVSVRGSRILEMATVVPGSIFIDLGVDASKINSRRVVPTWSPENQCTIETLPEEIRFRVHDDQDAGLSDISEDQVHPAKPNHLTKNGPPTKQQKQRKAREFKHPYNGHSGSGEPQIQYKTRDLIALPASQQGRVNRRRPANQIIRQLGDTAIIVAIIVVKSLLGGAEGTIDFGLILKIFPEKSFTRLKNYWPKACKQRKRFVDALTDKFQSSFLEAYEKGELPPIDLNNPEEYDWTSLIIWASKLETHDDVELPYSRDELDETYLLEDPDDEIIDWREVWFSNVAVHTRVEANIAKPATLPACPQPVEDQLTVRARSWIRSLCITPMGEVGAPNRVMRKLLELGNGDEQKTNRIFTKVVTQLIREKIATRGKSKKFGFRLNYNFDKIVEKSANTDKFRQAAAFKSRLDEAFRHRGEMLLPYASEDGSILAAINLQACGRICMEPVGLPDIPFGFEPGNYEGRSYPKSYYHWKVRLLPTATYLYNEDMPLLDEVRRARAPLRGLPYNGTGGAGGTIPIWVDLLGRVDAQRWVDYVAMLAFALATKGPMTPASATVILRPVVEPFEVELIMDFLDRLGVLQRAALCPSPVAGVSAGEWWWLAVGTLIETVMAGTGTGV
ncbi:hypothetical protein SLS62_010880 [Diatrype stigma]|uniref:C2H2-type domain-containing protein n=1 Tax=Diatrype stigma TaxID=117547 RepID=A0AAN9U7B5_9PEZI